jgi:hypothetical protein
MTFVEGEYNIQLSVLFNVIFTRIRCIVCSCTDISLLHFIISFVSFHSRLNEWCNLYVFFIFDIWLFQVKFCLFCSDEIEETDTLVSVNKIYVCHLSCHGFLDEVILRNPPWRKARYIR